ncbi:hypothetical protein AgCh_006078 [Apium graveolens]
MVLSGKLGLCKVFMSSIRVMVIPDSVKTKKEEILFHMDLQILSAYVEAVNAENFKEEEMDFEREERAQEGKIKTVVDKADQVYKNMLKRFERNR